MIPAVAPQSNFSGIVMTVRHSCLERDPLCYTYNCINHSNCQGPFWHGMSQPVECLGSPLPCLTLDVPEGDPPRKGSALEGPGPSEPAAEEVTGWVHHRCTLSGNTSPQGGFILFSMLLNSVLTEVTRSVLSLGCGMLSCAVWIYTVCSGVGSYFTDGFYPSLRDWWKRQK